MTAGRPKKYNEDCRNTAFTFPISLVDYLDSIATETNSNRNEVTINIILSSNKDMVIKLTKDQIALRESYSNMAKNYSDLVKRLNDNTATMLFKQVEEEPMVKEFLNQANTEYKAWIERGTMTEQDLMDKFEIWLYNNKGLTVKNNRIIKIIFKSWLDSKNSPILIGLKPKVVI